ncbi:MAG: 16S rRNA (adenine(1518)-N(6)/adenine(1519)-N(6))-dimethyltransferase RsmA [Nevskia sp.]|nr:16S rRNA (adenine(1518)-N(6)/adenine(1519)-N(6))-dimethyltransferase RsmA [Nevskia sp.]
MSGGHAAKKHFGQHFLHDPQVIERIVRCIDPQPDDLLVEIGPGLGALTVPLLGRLNELHVVEIDRDVVPHLRAACGDAPGLQLHLADALRFDYGSLARPGRPLRLAGNLPYNISTPLLFHLLRFSPCIRDMHFMLQKEVVDRLIAAPGTNDYGRLTATVAVRAQAEGLFTIGPGAFRPPPKVDSAVVRITPRPAPFAVADLAAYDRIVTAAFSQRRKTLGNALRQLLPAAAIEAAGIDPRVRGETLAPAEFARLANAFEARRRASAQQAGHI